MRIKTLLTHVGYGEATASRVRAAADLAIALDALLIGLGAQSLPPYSVDACGVSAQLLPLLTDQQTEALATARTLFEANAQGARVAWLSSHRPPTEAMAESARAADLLVVGGGLTKGDRYRTVNESELVVTAGRPVLVVPHAGGRLNANCILIAWKDGREARRAVTDALPFLLRAEMIVILALCERDEADATRAQVNDVAGWLKRQGATAARCEVGQTPDHLADVQILNRAQALMADLIVAGGYGRSRAAEWVLGGVTRSLLNQPKQFLLLSH